MTGWIKEAEILHPHESWEDSCYKYTVQLHPEEFHVFDDITNRLGLLKQSSESFEHNPDYTPYSHKDKLFDGCVVLFESIRKPTLIGELKDVHEDMEFVNRYVKLIGDLRLHKDGNAYISFHLVEPLTRESWLDDDLEDGDDIF